MRACSIDGCGRRHYGRGWCHLHWSRWRQNGDPLKVQVIVGDDEARLWLRVRKTPGCWEWTGGKSRDGYGVLRWRGKMRRVHRIVHELLVGPIPDHLVIDHLCRVRHCCNPEHFELVTSEENSRRQVPVEAQKVSCPAGHAYDVGNTYLTKTGKRMCRECHRLRQQALRARRRTAAVASC